MENKEITLRFKSWHWSCGDGCCDNYGTELYMNDELLDHPVADLSGSYLGDDIEQAMRAVLTKLGYEVKIINE